MWGFLFLLILVPLSVFAKKTVCTITLNSDNEKKVFQSKFKNEDLKFVELTDYAKGLKNRDQWFSKACESGVQCDSLIISGHFAGTFFGQDTDLTLPLETLNQKSCSKQCQGILNNPSEVYLFGCNTLAGKGKDSRSPQEYRQVLIEDAISEEYADRIVASRYSPIGEAFVDSMQKVFSGVPQIYGFDSVGPSGKNVEPKLKSYVSKIPNYSDRLNQMMAMKVLAQIKRTNDVGSKFGTPWGESMTGTAFNSCSGNLPEERKECGLIDPNKSTQEKLLLAESLLNSPERKKYFLSVEEYFKDIDPKKLSADDRAILKRISAQTEAANELRAAMPKLAATPELKYKMMDLGQKLGWIDEHFMGSEYQNQLQAAAKTGFHGEVATSLCSIKNPPEVNSANIKPEWFRSPGFITVLGCWQTTTGGKLSSYAMSELGKQLNNSDGETVASVMAMMTTSGSVAPEAQVKIAENLYSKDSGVAAAAMAAVAKIESPDPRVIQIVARGMQSSNAEERRRAAFTVRNMKLQDAELKRQALQIAPTMQPW